MEESLLWRTIVVVELIVILTNSERSKIVLAAMYIKDSHFGERVSFMHVLQAKLYLTVENVAIFHAGN